MSNLAQNFIQLRTLCLIEQEHRVHGILTNFKEWIFTKYSLMNEAGELIRQTDDRAASYGLDLHPFEIS